MANEAEFHLKKQKKEHMKPKDAKKVDQYYKDQLLFLKMKELKIEDRKKREEENYKKTYTFKPTLSEHTQKMKEREKKENEGGINGDATIHDRLFINTKTDRKSKKQKMENIKENNKNKVNIGDI